MLTAPRMRNVFILDIVINQTLSKRVLTCLLVIRTHSNQVFCPVDDGGVGDAGNERVRHKRQARELEHSHGEEKETE